MTSNDRHHSERSTEDPLQAIAGTARPPVIAPGHTFGTVTDKISSIVLTRKTSLGWYAAFGFAFLLTLSLLLAVTSLVVEAIDIWPNHVPIGCAFATTNSVCW